MATKKATEVVQEETTQETEAVESKKVSAMEEIVEIELFKDNKDYKDDVFVCINGRSMAIKRGEKVKIPRAFAEVLENSRKQDLSTARLMEEKADEFSAESRARNI